MSTQAWRRVPQRPARIPTTITPAMLEVTTRAGPQATRSPMPRREIRCVAWRSRRVGAPLHALGEHVLVLQHRMQGQIRRRSGAICQRDAGIGTGSGHAPHHHANTAVSPAPAHRQPRPEPSTPARCTRRSARIIPGTCPKCGMTLEPLLPDLDDDNPECVTSRVASGGPCR